MKKLLVVVLLQVAASLCSASTLILSDFSSLDGTLKNSWTSAGSISLGTLVIGTGAKDELGFEKIQDIDATGFVYLAVTAKIDAGNESGFALQFLNDNDLGEYTININSSSFSSAFQTVYVPLNWTEGSIGEISTITSWNIGGGSTGSNNFRYTIDNISLTTAIPEPASVTALLGFAALGYAATRRRRSVA